MSLTVLLSGLSSTPLSPAGKLKYQAQSPDEDALVSAARNFGFVFLSRTPSSITIRTPRGEEEHEVLCILDFNNVRKRMSVILRHAGRIRLYCKGADNIVFERLGNVEPETKARTEEHLQVREGEEREEREKRERRLEGGL